MSKYTITPWRTQADLLQVRQQLYRLDRDTADLRQHAVDRVMAWKLRGNLPHAVESTALLVDAVLHHHNEAGNGHSSFSVRAVYSAAFSRFVTGFCDIGRSKERSLEPSSMLEIARQIDMPVEFVALRHEATHEELPGLRRLAHATDEALRWLWTAYWGRLNEPVVGSDVEIPRLKTEARQVLRTFRSARRDAIRLGKYERAEQGGLVAETARSCAELCGGNAEKIDALASVFVEDKLLCPSKREYVTVLSIQKTPELTQNEQRRLLTALVTCLLQAIGNGPSVQIEQDPEKEAFYIWLKHILNEGAWTVTLSKLGVTDLGHWAMKWCCLYPGYWTQSLGKALIESSEAEFSLVWKDILRASELQSMDSESTRLTESHLGAAEVGLSSTMADSDAQSNIQDSWMDGSHYSGWARVAVSMNTPLGLIR